MPRLALALCLGLEAILLVIDVRRRPSVSAAVWLPVVLLLILGSRSISEWLGIGSLGGSSYSEDGSPLDRVFYLAIMSTSLIVILMRGLNWHRFIGNNASILALYLYFALSVLWSDFPLSSFKRCVKDFGFLLVIAVVWTEKDPMQAMRAAYVRCASILLPLSVVLIKYFPQWGRAYTLGGDSMYTGVTTQKNTLGELVLICILFLVWDWVEGRGPGARRRNTIAFWTMCCLLAMGLWLLKLSQSRTALACLLVGSGLCFLKGRRFNFRTANMAILVAALFLPVGILLTNEFGWMIAPLVEALGRDMTFTGRTELWSQINWSTVNPIGGAGFWCFWGGKGGAAIKQALDTTIPSAHNGYLDIYLDGGFIGVVLLFVMLASRGRRIIQYLSLKGNAYASSPMRFQRFRFAVLIVAILYNASESAFARPMFIWFTTLLALYEFPHHVIRQAKQNVPVTVQRRAIESHA